MQRKEKIIDFFVFHLHFVFVSEPISLKLFISLISNKKMKIENCVVGWFVSLLLTSDERTSWNLVFGVPKSWGLDNFGPPRTNCEHFCDLWSIKTIGRKR